MVPKVMNTNPETILRMLNIRPGHGGRAGSNIDMLIHSIAK
jgi:hypothetical protein